MCIHQHLATQWQQPDSFRHPKIGTTATIARATDDDSDLKQRSPRRPSVPVLEAPQSRISPHQHIANTDGTAVGNDEGSSHSNAHTTPARLGRNKAQVCARCSVSGHQRAGLLGRSTITLAISSTSCALVLSGSSSASNLQSQRTNRSRIRKRWSEGLSTGTVT
jgi:hypothetical protein